MKKIFLLPIIALLLLPSCLPARQLTESPLELNPADRSLYKDGLAPEYQDVLNELPYATAYDLKFNIADR